MFCCTGGNQRDKAREKAGKKGPAKKASDSSANAGTSLTDRKQRFVLPLTNIVIFSIIIRSIFSSSFFTPVPIHSKYISLDILCPLFEMK